MVDIVDAEHGQDNHSELNGNHEHHEVLLADQLVDQSWNDDSQQQNLYSCYRHPPVKLVDLGKREVVSLNHRPCLVNCLSIKLTFIAP